MLGSVSLAVKETSLRISLSGVSVLEPFCLTEGTGRGIRVVSKVKKRGPTLVGLRIGALPPLTRDKGCYHRRRDYMGHNRRKGGPRVKGHRINHEGPYLTNVSLLKESETMSLGFNFVRVYRCLERLGSSSTLP